MGSATHYHTADVSPDWGPKMLRVAQVGLHIFYRFNPHAPDIQVAPQTAVFTALAADSAKGQPTLRLAAALVQKADTQPATAAQQGKDAKAVVKLPDAPPHGLSKASDAEPAKSAETAAS